MKLDIYKVDGKKSSKKADLCDTIFAVEPNEGAIYEDVRRHMANKRQGTHKTKGRSEVTGSTKKMYRQKGTGSARRGDAKSPLLRKGGTAFGPQPRDYGFKLNKKVVQLARKSALSMKAGNKAIMIVDDFKIESPKTKEITSILTGLELSDKKVLLLTTGGDLNIYKSARNLKKVEVLEASKPNTYQILRADLIVILESAVDLLEGSFKQKNEEAAA